MRTSYQSTFLPHLMPIGGQFFVTFNLFDAIPNALMIALKAAHEQRKQAILFSNKPDKAILLYRELRFYFSQYDEALDKLHNGIKHLENKEIAQIVNNKILEFDGIWYDLIAVTIMLNHVHVVFDFSMQVQENVPITDDTYMQLDRVMKRIKGATGLEGNRYLKRTGVSFWQRESYDHWVRDEKELHRIIRYVAQNPVKAGLTKDWENWQFTYVSPKYKEFAKPQKPKVDSPQ